MIIDIISNGFIWPIDMILMGNSTLGQSEPGSIGINYFTRKKMGGDLIETFKIINGISNYGRHFSIFLLKLEIYCKDRFQKLLIEFFC